MHSYAQFIKRIAKSRSESKTWIVDRNNKAVITIIPIDAVGEGFIAQLKEDGAQRLQSPKYIFRIWRTSFALLLMIKLR